MQKRGEIGECIACKHFINKGFYIVERNFTRPWGEIDIVAKKSGKIHFIEVKSVTRETLDFRAEDQVHAGKQRKLSRVIETYLAMHDTGEWQFDVACVFLDMKKRTGRVRIIEDIVLFARN